MSWSRPASGERLQFLEVDVKTNPRLNSPLPAFMLQPLVEYAVGHGMKPDGSTLHLTIRGRIDDGMLVLSVIVGTTGNGDRAEAAPRGHLRAGDPSTGLGIALGNVRDRLKGFFGHDSRLVIHSTQGVGTTAEMVIPCTDSECRSDAETV